MKTVFNLNRVAVFAVAAMLAVCGLMDIPLLPDAVTQGSSIAAGAAFAFGMFGTTLAADTPRTYELGNENHLPVIAADIIYEGAAVGADSSDNMRPLVAGDPFRGFALQNVDNAAGAAGAANVRLLTRGRIQLSVTGVTAATDVGKPVYASDDNAFTLTATSNSFIGRIIRWVSGTTCIVEFDAARGGLGEVVALTDGSGGAATTALPVCTATNINVTTAIGNIANAIASLAARTNEISQQLRT